MFNSFVSKMVSNFSVSNWSLTPCISHCTQHVPDARCIRVCIHQQSVGKSKNTCVTHLLAQTPRFGFSSAVPPLITKCGRDARAYYIKAPPQREQKKHRSKSSQQDRYCTLLTTSRTEVRGHGNQLQTGSCHCSLFAVRDGTSPLAARAQRAAPRRRRNRRRYLKYGMWNHAPNDASARGDMWLSCCKHL